MYADVDVVLHNAVCKRKSCCATGEMEGGMHIAGLGFVTDPINHDDFLGHAVTGCLAV